MDRVGDGLPDAIEQNGGKRNERSGARPSIDVKEEQKKVEIVRKVRRLFSRGEII